MQGYVDDTTIAGDGQDLTWIGQVESCYQELKTAGFVMDTHSCYFACVVINNRAPPLASVDSTWPGLMNTKPYPTAILANMRQGYNTVLVRKGTLADASKRAEATAISLYGCRVYLPAD